ncbi:MAG: MFS transporter [Acidimicrobiia bacterium]|nr:MFS transporter [Acidimicrobiia bacterium]
MKEKLGVNYWKLWTASVVSNFGDGVSLIAYPWLASAVTRNPFHIAMVGVATRIPWLFFSLPAGVITDRVDRRKLVGSMDLIRFVVTSGVAVAVLTSQGNLASIDDIAAGVGQLPSNAGFLLAVIYAAALLMGIAEVLRDNSAQTLLPSIISKGNLERANGRLWGAEMIMNSFAGPPASGFLLAVAFSLPFFVDAGTFAVAAALLFTISGNFKPKVDPDVTVGTKRSFTGELKEGVRWLWGHPLFKPMAIALGVINALFTMAGATYVLFVQEILELDAAQFGVLMTAGAAGGVLGSLVASKISERIGQGASLFLAILVSGLALSVTGLTSSATVVWIMFAIQSVFVVLWNIITVSLRQALIPDSLLGRVNSVYRFLGWGMMPIGAILGGALVVVMEPLAGREWALRIPFLVAAGAHLLLFVYVLPKLNSTRIAEARQASGESSAALEGLAGES